jgi:hypothetical protein
MNVMTNASSVHARREAVLQRADIAATEADHLRDPRSLKRVRGGC